ncbi:MAG: DUF3857 domain-containing protein [Prevotellaceae bacterium]|jgi:hypothetical protein|nr:DUF3857 domain-containing protein [Prevotellaceae bacterium]
MKKLLLLSLLSCCSAIYAQDKFKFGTCPIELLQMESYEKFPDANAFVVYENAYTYYSVSGATADFELHTEYVVRIKILTQDGVNDYGTADVFFTEGASSDESESINGLTGFTYNLENGKIVKEKLSKEYIFKEDITENYKRMKFAFPNVRVGSVVEYKYMLISPSLTPNDFVFQRDIPVKTSTYTIKIPEYFSFRKNAKGYERVAVTSKLENESFMFGGNIFGCSAEEITAQVTDLPALKREDYVWSFEDYKTRIVFEFRSVQIPGVYYHDITPNWNRVIGGLMGSEKFGKQFNNKRLFKDDLPNILQDKNSDLDSIRAILNFVRSKVKFNDNSTYFIQNQSKALKDGVGSSAEINALLINALKNAGFKAYPVLMSMRSKGILTYTLPSYSRLNYFVVQVQSNGKTYYIDGTYSYTDINVLPLECIVGNAVVVYEKTFEWVNLKNIGNGIKRTVILASFNEQGELSGKYISTNSVEEAFVFQQNYENAENEDKYIDSLEAKNDITISDFKIEEKFEPNYNFVESYNFLSKNISLENDIISFNPLLFLALKNNAFQAETRNLPVEFPFISEHRVNVTISLPDGYQIEELPESERFFVGDNKRLEYSYIIQNVGNMVQLACKFNINTTVVSSTEYENLRDFWAKTYNKENEMITIKKVEK